MNELANKNDSEKNRVELVPSTFIEEVAQVMTYGAKKYEANNWRKGLPWMRTYGAALRHMYAWARGETQDPESGFNHLAHAVCNLMFLMEYQKTHKDMDDRYAD